MTRQEFLEEVIDMDSLFSFVYESGYDNVVEDVYSRDRFNEWVWDSIQGWCDGWDSLGSWLCSLPDPDDYDYFDMSWGDVTGLCDDDAQRYIDTLLEQLDNDNFFEEDEIEDDEEYDGEYVLDNEPKPQRQDPEECDRFLTLLTAYA